MASQTQGIQQLLIAEKKAAEKVICFHFVFSYLILTSFIIQVQEARKKKTRRLKQAKEEALAEIERFRVERDQTFRDYESKHMGSM